MKNNTRLGAFVIFLLSLFSSSHCHAQHYDLFYTCVNPSYHSDIRFLEPQNGYASIDFGTKTIVFHNLSDSQVVDFKTPEYNDLDHEWRLSLPKKDAGDSWDGYILRLDESNKEALWLSRRYTMKGEGKFYTSPKKTMYKYPPLMLRKNLFLTCKDVVAVGTDIPNLRGDEYACFKQIINTPKRENNVEVEDKGEELVFTEKPYDGKPKLLYTVVKNNESLVLISKPKHHGIYFNGPDKNDSTMSYEVFYGVNNHLDMSKPILELLVYKDGVFQKIWFLGELYSDKENERDYVPYVPPVISGCQRCKSTGKVVGVGICKRCNGRGYQKTTLYRSADQVVKRESHSDGSQTITYLKQGFSSNVYQCDLCNGTGHKLETCAICGGTGKIKTPGH